jgi:hypothetical protein
LQHSTPPIGSDQIVDPRSNSPDSEIEATEPTTRDEMLPEERRGEERRGGEKKNGRQVGEARLITFQQKPR